MTIVTPMPVILTEMQSIGCSATKTWLTNSRKMNDDEAFCQLRAHAGYVYPDLFVDYYIRNTSYQLLALKDFHIEILNAIKPGVYGKQINVQAPRGTGKTTLVNGLIPLWRICYKHFDLAMDRQPEEFILIVSRNEPMACQRITEIRQVLEEQSPHPTQDFGDLVGDVPVGEKPRPTPSNGIATPSVWVAVRHLVVR